MAYECLISDETESMITKNEHVLHLVTSVFDRRRLYTFSTILQRLSGAPQSNIKPALSAFTAWDS